MGGGFERKIRIKRFLLKRTPKRAKEVFDMQDQSIKRKGRVRPMKNRGISAAETFFNLQQTQPRLDPLASFLEMNPNPVLGVKVDGSIQYPNPAAQQFFLALEDMGLQHNWLVDLRSIGTLFKYKKETPHIPEIGKVVRVENYSELLKKWYSISVYNSEKGDCVAVFEDITERKRVEEERERLVHSLQDTLAKIRRLHGMLPICCSCKKIRDDKGYWNHLEVYIQEHSEAAFTHGICPDCLKELYGVSLDEDGNLSKGQVRRKRNSCIIRE